VIRWFAAALALVAIGASVPVAAARAQSASPYDGPCLDNVGITVVIDFRELGGGVNVRCTGGAASSGLDALDLAGVAWEPVLRFPGFVCRIAGKPGPDAEACINTPPASAYWTYWLAPRGGQWCYSTVGPGTRTPPPGTVEGWSFALDKVGAEVPAPGYAPPPPIDGQQPNPLNRSDCGTPLSTTPPPPATTSPQPVSTTVQAVQPSPTTPTPAIQAASEVPTATTATRGPVSGSGSIATTSTVGTTSAPTTEPSIQTSIQTPTRTGSTELSRAAGLAVSPTSTTPNPSSVPLGTVDLGDDGRGDGGFGVATFIGIVVAALLVGAGVWAARRRRLTP
jgi:hypothetical protein